MEHIACGKLVGMLPPELQPDFAEALTPTDPEVEELVKAADKLSAHIKCLEELKAGNLEFRRAAEQTEQALDDFHLPELTYFREHFLPSFRLTLDEMGKIKRRRDGSSPLRLIRYEPCSPCVLCMAAGFSQLCPPTTPQRSSAVARHHPCCGTDHDIPPKQAPHIQPSAKKKSRRKATLPACQGHTIIICQRPRT